MSESMADYDITPVAGTARIGLSIAVDGVLVFAELTRNDVKHFCRDLRDVADGKMWAAGGSFTPPHKHEIGDH